MGTCIWKLPVSQPPCLPAVTPLRREEKTKKLVSMYHSIPS